MMKLTPWAYHLTIVDRSVVSVFRLISGLALSGLSVLCPFPGTCREHVVHQKPPPRKTTKIQNHCSTPLIYSSFFFPTCGTTFHTLFPAS